MVKSVLTTLCCLCLSSIVNAQDVYFTQWERARTITNPAFIGKDASVYWNSGYRNQWPNLQRNYVTYYSALDLNIKPMRGGCAFNYMKDMMADGSTATENYSVALSRRFQFTKLLKITLALQASYSKASVKPAQLNFTNYTIDRFKQISSTVSSFNNQQKNYADFITGLLVDMDAVNVGFVFAHLTRPSVSFTSTIEQRLSSKFIWHASTKAFSLNGKNKLSIGIMGSYQNKADMYLAHATLSHNRLLFTGGYNFKNAVFGGVGYKLKHFSLNYTFDISTLKTYAWSTSHELNFGMNF